MCDCLVVRCCVGLGTFVFICVVVAGVEMGLIVVCLRCDGRGASCSMRGVEVTRGGLVVSVVFS